jgi:hypothetical protein
MEIEGKIWKEGTMWLVEIPSLDAMTQAKTRKGVVAMAKNLVFEMVQSYFPDEIYDEFKVTVSDSKKNLISITANETKLLLALSLRRQREKSGSTVKEAAERLGSKSPNAYAQYERGQTSITVEKFEHLLIAANPREKRRLRLV